MDYLCQEEVDTTCVCVCVWGGVGVWVHYGMLFIVRALSYDESPKFKE